MWKKRLCLSLSSVCGMPYEEQLPLFKNTGFDGFFVTWNPNLDVLALANKARELAMMFQSIHAPWDKAADFWHRDEIKAQKAIDELKACIDSCALCGVPILVVHAFIGFEEHNPTETGLVRFGQVVDYAKEKAIRIAFENTEGEEYLAALMEHFAGDDTVGFCWDSGHEMCYNHSQDLLEKYGDRLLCTHLNDNLGIKAYDGTITWLDDLHLLPFDGIADWKCNVQRLHKCNFRDILTFELNLKSKPGRHENDPYTEMSYEKYVAEAYKRACRIAAMLLAEEGKN